MAAMTLAMAAGIAGAAPAQDWQPQPDLSWLGGYWLECDGDREVAETWSERVGGIQIGYSITRGLQAFSWELMRIEARGDKPTDLAFTAQPRGGEPTVFPLLSAGTHEVVFENKAHDFPQRITYRRDGNRLTGTISGTTDGKMDSMSWIYQAAAQNSHCWK